MMKSLPRVAPHEVGIDATKMLNFVKRINEAYGIHGFMLVRHGKVAAEGMWYPYQQDCTHVLFSLSKTFTATAIGFAVQEGLLTVEDTVWSFFDDQLPAGPCEMMLKMKIKHLLTMATGHEQEPNEITNLNVQNWIQRFLTSYVPHEPGTYWRYNSPATYMLSAIISKVTGQTVYDYLTPRLFEPLGFENHWWETCPSGNSAGGYGFNVRIEDIAKFGLLYLNGGVYDGKRLLDEAWVKELSANHMDNSHAEDDPNRHNEGKQGYGYQVWQCSPKNVYRADGAFGQFCVIMPDQDAVMVFLSGDNNPCEMLAEFFDTVMSSMSDDMPEDRDTEHQLHKFCETLTIPMVSGLQHGIQEQKYSGKQYQLSKNEGGLEQISMEFGAQPMLHFTMDGQAISLPVGYNEWICSETGVAERRNCSVGGRFFSHAGVCGAWKSNTFTAKIAYYKTPFIDTISITFDEHGVVVRLTRNVGFVPVDYTCYGRLIEG